MNARGFSIPPRERGTGRSRMELVQPEYRRYDNSSIDVCYRLRMRADGNSPSPEPDPVPKADNGA